jgi:hypothetical protein
MIAWVPSCKAIDPSLARPSGKKAGAVSLAVATNGDCHRMRVELRTIACPRGCQTWTHSMKATSSLLRRAPVRHGNGAQYCHSPLRNSREDLRTIIVNPTQGMNSAALHSMNTEARLWGPPPPLGGVAGKSRRDHNTLSVRTLPSHPFRSRPRNSESGVVVVALAGDRRISEVSETLCRTQSSPIQKSPSRGPASAPNETDPGNFIPFFYSRSAVQPLSL